MTICDTFIQHILHVYFCTYYLSEEVNAITRTIQLDELQARLAEIKLELERRDIVVPVTEDAIDELLAQKSIPTPDPYVVQGDKEVNPLARSFGLTALLGRVLSKLEVLFAEELKTPSMYDGDDVTDEMLNRLVARFSRH